MPKITRLKIKLKKKDKLYLIKSSGDVVFYLHNQLVDKIVVEVERGEG